ncbi:hypothetical protein [Desulfovibrio subterraneus]|uniref:hypothetical protein n=1 Tax=Desulfovibrio subterraneus TaxID=2718620 RepID=UPI00157A3A99|nr:hypothetical protein [Desulfovibrio subterraneus]
MDTNKDGISFFRSIPKAPRINGEDLIAFIVVTTSLYYSLRSIVVDRLVELYPAGASEVMGSGGAIFPESLLMGIPLMISMATSFLITFFIYSSSGNKFIIKITLFFENKNVISLFIYASVLIVLVSLISMFDLFHMKSYLDRNVPFWFKSLYIVMLGILALMILKCTFIIMYTLINCIVFSILIACLLIAVKSNFKDDAKTDSSQYVNIEMNDGRYICGGLGYVTNNEFLVYTSNSTFLIVERSAVRTISLPPACPN